MIMQDREFLTTKEASEIYQQNGINFNSALVANLASKDGIPNAQFVGNRWYIPVSSVIAHIDAIQLMRIEPETQYASSTEDDSPMMNEPTFKRWVEPIGLAASVTTIGYLTKDLAWWGINNFFTDESCSETLNENNLPFSEDDFKMVPTLIPTYTPTVTLPENHVTADMEQSVGLLKTDPFLLFVDVEAGRVGYCSDEESQIYVMPELAATSFGSQFGNVGQFIPISADGPLGHLANRMSGYDMGQQPFNRLSINGYVDSCPVPSAYQYSDIGLYGELGFPTMRDGGMVYGTIANSDFLSSSFENSMSCYYLAFDDEIHQQDGGPLNPFYYPDFLTTMHLQNDKDSRRTKVAYTNPTPQLAMQELNPIVITNNTTTQATVIANVTAEVNTAPPLDQTSTLILSGTIVAALLKTIFKLGRYRL